MPATGAGRTSTSSCRPRGPRSRCASGSTPETDRPTTSPAGLVDDIEATTNRPPTVSWTNPTDGEEVSGSNVDIVLDADDPEDATGTLDVDWRADGGAWQNTSFSSGAYRASWDSTGVDDGSHTLEARAKDASGLEAFQSIDVTTENVDSPPDVAWEQPADGAAVQGDSVPIAFSASDPEGGTLSNVRWRVGTGTWRTAAYDPADDRYEATWDSTEVSDGSYQLNAEASDGSNIGTDQITVQVANEGPAVLGQWDGSSTSGWSMTGLWKQSSTSCVPTGSTSGRPAFYYGRDGGNCNYHTGSRTQGFLTSPQISGVGETVHLHFDYWRQVESYSGGAYDRTQVQVSYDDGSTWSTVWNRGSRNASEATWRNEHLTLTAAGEQMRVRFWFDSRDNVNNTFRGWIIDDVRVTTEGPAFTPTRFEASAEEPGRWDVSGM